MVKEAPKTKQLGAMEITDDNVMLRYRGRNKKLLQNYEDNFWDRCRHSEDVEEMVYNDWTMTQNYEGRQIISPSLKI